MTGLNLPPAIALSNEPLDASMTGASAASREAHRLERTILGIEKHDRATVLADVARALHAVLINTSLGSVVKGLLVLDREA
jgi:hypothetical protein